MASGGGTGSGTGTGGTGTGTTGTATLVRTLTDTPLSHPNMSLVTFSGNDPRQNANEFWSSVEQKINFSLGTTLPTDAAALANHQNRRKALFGSLLTETALEWFNTIDPTRTLDQIKGDFINRFTDSRDQFKYRLEVEGATRQEGELIKNYFHRIKHAVDRGWPEKIPARLTDPGQIATERTIQQRQREQKYIDFAIRGLQPPSLKRKAHEYRIENPDKTWDEIQNHLITKDLTFTVSTDGTVKQTNDKISSLEAQIKELTSLIRNNEVSAINSGSFKDPNVKGRPNNTRFCNYCRNHGHSISNCSKHRIDEGFKKMKRELTEEKEKKTSFSTDYKKQTNSKPYFNNQNRPNNTNSGYDNRRYGNKHYNNNNNKSYEQKFPQNNQFSPHETEARQYYERENQNFQRSYPPQAHNNQFQASSSRYYDQQLRLSHSVHWVEDRNQQTEFYDQNNYTDAITDFFPLNF